MLDYPFVRRLTGGIRLPANKTQSTELPITRGFLPREVVLPLRQHQGAVAVPIVEVGQHVRAGELVASAGSHPSAAVHASITGRVRAIEERPVPAGDALRLSTCIVIERTEDASEAAATAAPPVWPAERAAQLELIRAGGLAGLGGAVFPTADKLATLTGCKALIVNGAECEPYISCDDLLMREAAADVVAGALAIATLAEAPLCIIAVERDKPRAIEALRVAGEAVHDPRLRIAEVPTVYPAGGERQLIELLTGEEVPSGCFPNAIGYLCQNVGTAYALNRWLTAGEPLTARVVTVTGGGVKVPQNVWTPLGARVGDLIEFCGGYTDDVVRLVVGGSMMGYAVPDDDIPVTKATNCIIAASAAEVRDDADEWPCIRCGECSTACPARLLPQELHVAARFEDYEALEPLGLDDCIECGICDVVCPSHIPLTERFRGAKRGLAVHRERVRFAAESDERFQRRERRLAAGAERETELRTVLKSVVRGDREATKRAIEAAVRRARARRGEDRDPG